MANQTTEPRLHTCPDCKCQFVQPFVCTTCGAQKLYDVTVRTQAEDIKRLLHALSGVLSQFDHAGCTCAFPSDDCCSYARGMKLVESFT